MLREWLISENGTVLLGLIIQGSPNVTTRGSAPFPGIQLQGDVPISVGVDVLERRFQLLKLTGPL